MVLKQIAQAVNYCKNVYKTKPKVKALANTAGVYLGIRIAGNLIGIKSPELEQLVDMSAPVISGLYANNQLNKDEVVKDGVIKTTAKIGLAGLVGWDVADKLIDYNGINDAITFLRDGYYGIHVWAANNITDWHDESSTGFLMGVTGGLINRISQHYHNLQNN